MGKPDDEDGAELAARALLEREFGCPLIRIAPTAVPTVDYRTAEPARGIEVKQITSEAYKDLSAASGRARHWDSAVLTGRWSVLIERPTLSDVLAPMPRFPDDDPDLIAHYEASGMRVQRKADRQAEWRAQHPGPKRTTPRLKDLGRDLEAHLALLEQGDISCTRGAWSVDGSVREALWVIAKRTGNAICVRHELLADQRPGIDVHLSSGYVRTERADTIVERIVLWLASEDSANLKASLANEERGERHAVLVFDAHTEPEHETASKQGLAFRPTAEPSLVDEIDVLWFILGPIACSFSPADGWRTMPMPASTAGHVSAPG